MSETNQPEKKIIIDEDWKSQVEAEKAAARQAGAADAPDKAEKADAEPHLPLPPPTFSFLIGTLYLQGVMALGMMPHPATGKSESQPEQAKHAIDMLAMLEEKTAGNRTPDETAELDAALHELRLAFVQVRG
jgi:hypothetical protein